MQRVPSLGNISSKSSFGVNLNEILGYDADIINELFGNKKQTQVRVSKHGGRGSRNVRRRTIHNVLDRLNVDNADDAPNPFERSAVN